MFQFLRFRSIVPALLALALWPGLESGALAASCPTPPRDWTPKTLDAFAEGGAIWKLNHPDMPTETLAAALRNAYAGLYHDPGKVPEPPFLERFHDPRNWKKPGDSAVNTSTFDYQARDAYLQDTELAKTAIGEKLPAGWSWGPNPAHSSYDLLKFDNEASRKSAKCRSDGLVLIGYYKWIDNLAGPARTPEAINEKRRNPQYLVSIMDLTKDHLPWLKKMKGQAIRWLKDTYDVQLNEGDTVRMYFHWPTGHPTSTLHMHVRVNWRMSPVEYIHSYMLDDIIHALEGGRTVDQMIAERYKRLGGVIIDGNFESMTAAGESPANLLDRYLQSVADNGTPIFSRAKELLPDAFGSVKDILRTAQVVDGGRKYYVQRAVGNEKSTNIVRVDKLDPGSKWPSANQNVFTPDEIDKLKLANYPGTLTGLLSCLLPYFDDFNANDCVKINAGGTGVERYPSFDDFKAGMSCPAAHSCYAAKVERTLGINGFFRLWITDEDWQSLIGALNGVDAGKIDFKGYVDGIESPGNTFKVKDVGGRNIVNGIPERERNPMKLEKEYAQDEKIIAGWVGRFAVLAKPN